METRRKNASTTKRKSHDRAGGIIGIAIPIALLVGLAVSTYYDAPAMTGASEGGPAIHWGNRY